MSEIIIQFGCWNNKNTENGKTVGGLQIVMEAIKKYARKKHPRFLIVSGDNYYPHKEISADGNKTGKMVYPAKLNAGFDLLPRDLQIYMMLGNHDLETNLEKRALQIVDPPNETRDENNCEILQMEKANIRGKRNIEFSFFNSKMLKHGTLVLMIDTSIYEDDSKSYLRCYKEFFKNDTEIDQPINIASLRQHQRKKIKNVLENYKGNIKNIILVGHHPIMYLKYKENKDEKKDKPGKSEKEDKTKTEKSEKEKSEKEDKSEKGKSEKDKSEKKPKEKGIIIRDDINIKSLLEEIYIPDVDYHYLCSDSHLYQKGLLTLNFGEGKIMEIQQYIVGTGGTKLDDSIPVEELNKYIEANPVSIKNGIQYVFEEEKAQYGFLECVNTASGPSFTFINAEDTSISLKETLLTSGNFQMFGGKKTKKQNKKRKNKSNKKLTV